MNRRWLYFTPVAFLLLAAAQLPFGPGDAVRSIPQSSFGRGELIRYTVHYGLINGGEATVETAGSLERVNDRPCYKATVSGKTTGSFDFFLRIRDSGAPSSTPPAFCRCAPSATSPRRITARRKPSISTTSTTWPMCRTTTRTTPSAAP